MRLERKRKSLETIDEGKPCLMRFAPACENKTMNNNKGIDHA
jgi:hypothetical protein